MTRSLEHNLGVLLAEQDTASAQRRSLDGAEPAAAEPHRVADRIAAQDQSRSVRVPARPDVSARRRAVQRVRCARLRCRRRSSTLDAINEAQRGLASARGREAHLPRRALDRPAGVGESLSAGAGVAGARRRRRRRSSASSQAIHQQAIDLRAGRHRRRPRRRARRSAGQHRIGSAPPPRPTMRRRPSCSSRGSIGLPLGQEFTLVDDIPPVPEPDITLQQALDQAYANREDYQAALEELRAAEASRSAAVGRRTCRRSRVTADYGAIGLTPARRCRPSMSPAPSTCRSSTAAASRAALAQADAELRERTRRGRGSARRRSTTTCAPPSSISKPPGSSSKPPTRGRELADQQLQQSRDRFAAGVANNVEVVQAQEAVALATEQSISAHYGFSVAKALLAQSDRQRRRSAAAIP